MTEYENLSEEELLLEANRLIDRLQNLFYQWFEPEKAKPNEI